MKLQKADVYMDGNNWGTYWILPSIDLNQDWILVHEIIEGKKTGKNKCHDTAKKIPMISLNTKRVCQIFWFDEYCEV